MSTQNKLLVWMWVVMTRMMVVYFVMAAMRTFTWSMMRLSLSHCKTKYSKHHYCQQENFFHDFQIKYLVKNKTLTILALQI